MARLKEQAGFYLRQFGRMNRNARLYLLSNTLNSITVGIFALLYNLYLVALGYQADFIGWLLVIGVAGGALGIVTASPLMARVGAKATLFWSSVVAAVAGALQLLIPQPISLTVTSFVLGVAGGIYLVMGAPLLAEGSQETARSHIFSLNAALALITAVIGQALGGYLPSLVSLPAISQSALLRALDSLLVPGAQARSYELALLVAGIIAAPSFLPIILMDPTPPLRPGRRLKPRLQAFRHQVRLRGLPTPGAQALVLTRAGGFRGSRRLPLGAVLTASLAFLRAEALKLLRGPIGQLALVEGLIGLGAGLFLPYFNLYFVQHLGVSTALYGLITALSTTLMAVTTLAAPFFAARLGNVRAAVLGHLCSLPFLVLLGFTPALPLVLAAYLVRGSLMNMAEPVLLSFFMSVVRPAERGTASSAYNLSYWGCWAAGGAIGGVIIAANNFTLPFVLAALLYLLATALLWRCFKDRQEIKAPLPPGGPGSLPGLYPNEERPELDGPQKIENHAEQPQRGETPVHPRLIQD
jgi:MFS family permease